MKYWGLKMGVSVQILEKGFKNLKQFCKNYCNFSLLSEKIKVACNK